MMEKTVVLSVLLLSVFSLSMTSSVNAADKAKKTAEDTEEKESPKETAKDSGDAGSNFRCEKMRDATLTKLKEKLLSNCNLNKPFSITSSETLESTYTYCCNGKN